MSKVLGVIEQHGSQLISDESINSQGPSSEDGDDVAGRELNFTVHRARLLLLRSAVATISHVMSELSSFAHPYLLRTLSAALSLRCVDKTFTTAAAVVEEKES